MSRICFLLLIGFVVYTTAFPQHEHHHDHHHSHGAFTAEDCEEDAHEGRALCLGDAVAYSWNHEEKKCDEVVHGDRCTPSKNHFGTLEDCEKIAKALCSTIES